MRDIRVVIAEDDDLFREALTDVLDADPRFTVVGAAPDGAALISLVALTRPHVVLMDVRMPYGGPSAVRRVLEEQGHGDPARSQRIKVVAISADSGVPTVLSMLQAGVVGYLTKGRVGASLPDLVARCADGEVVLAVPTAADALHQLSRSHEICPA